MRNGGWGRARGARPPKPTQEGGGPPSCPRRAKKLDSFTAPPHTAPTYIALYPPKRLSLRRELASASVDDTDSPTSVTLAQRGLLATNRTPVTPDVRLYHRAVVVAQEATGERGVGCAEQGGGGGGGGGGNRQVPNVVSVRAAAGISAPSSHAASLPILPTTGSMRGMVRQLSIDQFENEGRRVSLGPDSVSKAAMPSPMFERSSSEPGVHKVGAGKGAEHAGGCAKQCDPGRR